MDCRIVCRVCFIMYEALKEGCQLDGAFGKDLLLFFLFSPCPIILSSLPLYGGGLTMLLSLFISLPFLFYSSQLFHCRLSLIADSVFPIGCSVG